MINVRRLTVISLCVASACAGNVTLQAQDAAIGAQQRDSVQALPAQWDLQTCIDYALRQNITIRKNRLNAESAEVGVKTAKAALFPSLTASVSQRIVNRPNSETNTIIDGDNITSSQSKTSYNGSYGIDANWTLYNGSKRLNTLKQQRMNNRIAELSVAESENNIEESITQIYVQILYAAEAVKVNEATLAVSRAECERARALLAAGSIAKSDLAQLEAQVSTDNYQLVTAQATLQDYKLQLKQLLELDGEKEMTLYIPTPGDENVLSPLPSKTDVYRSALTLRPEIEAGRLNVKASELDIDIARSGYIPTVSLSAGIGSTNTNGNDFTFGEQIKQNWNNSLGVTVSVPIFNNRQTKSAVQKAKAEQRTGLAGQPESLVQNHRRPMARRQQRTATLRCRHRKAAQYTNQLRPHPRAVQPRHEEHRGTADGEEQPAQCAAGNSASQIHGDTEHATAEILSGRKDYALTG